MINNKYTWTIRNAVIGDAVGIAKLHDEVYQKVYGRTNTPEAIWVGEPGAWWKWSQIDTPTKRSYTFVAEDNGKIIAHHSGQLNWVNIKGKKELALISWGSMTHPDYMRQGIIRNMEERREKRAREERVVVFFSANTEMGRQANLSFGWRDLGELDSLVKVLSTRNWLQMKTRSKVVGAVFGRPLDFALKLYSQGNYPRKNADIKIVEINSFDSRFDRLWAEVKESVPISVWRDSEYLNWRYVSRPGVKYRIFAAQDGDKVLGYMVFICVERRYRIGQILDFLFLPGKETEALVLIDGAIAHLREVGADIAEFQAFKHSPYYRLFISQGFRRRGRGSLWMVKQLADIGNIDVYDVRNWYLTAGDTHSPNSR
jgi:GNAT superfamily N-acetyltransferase